MTAESSSYDIVVVGAGPGGYAAAFLAADLGKRTALVDPEANPGGVCLYRGCIPSKALLHVAKLITEADDARAMGVDFGAPKISMEKLRDWKASVVHRLTAGLGQLTKQRKIDYYRGTASFVDARTLVVAAADGPDRTLTFGHAVVATGSRPMEVAPLGLDSPRVLNAKKALDLESIPRTLLVVGGGYIGLELGSVYAALGSKVSVVEMMPGLLPGADRDLVAVLSRRVKKSFESVRLNTRVSAMEELSDGVEVTLEGDKKDNEVTTAVYEKVLVSVGRRPNSTGFGLENTGVVVDDRGFIVVDEQRRTNEPSIFAIGDVAGEPMLAHKASHEARAAVEAIAGEKAAFDPRAIPAVMFTDPEVAWCGLTETRAREEGRDVAVAKFPWGASGRATTLERNDGLTKLIVDPGTDRILGVGIVGAGAGELIAEGVLAIEMGANASDLKLTIHPHPTLSETLMEAAEVYFGLSTHIYRPRPRRE